jgi:hypothetical protein
MEISFACACGKTLRSRAEAAGKRTKCPYCGAVFVIPPDSAAAPPREKGAGALTGSSMVVPAAAAPAHASVIAAPSPSGSALASSAGLSTISDFDPLPLEDGPAVAVGPKPEARAIGVEAQNGPSVAIQHTPENSPSAPTHAASSHDREVAPEWAKEYKILTQKDKGFSGKFDPARLEETLNSYARRGWSVKTALTMNLPGHAGNHDELIVILER